MRFIDHLGDRSDLMFIVLVLAEITLVGLISLVAMRLTRSDASTRYAIGVASLVLIALTIPATVILQRSGWSTIAWSRTVNVTPSVAGSPSSASTPGWVYFWLLGASILFFRIGLGAWQVHRQRRRATPVHSHHGVAVCVTDDIGPAAIGVFNPAILVPRELLDRLDEDEVRDVLTHEFAHVAHRHLLIAFFQRLLAGVFWPHPLVHLINRQVVLAREEVCDNAVLRSAGAARFARVLLRVAECRQGPRQLSASMGLFDPPTSLEERVKGLLDPNRRIDSRMNRRKLTIASLALILGVAAVAGARIQTHLVVGAAGDGFTNANPTKAKAKRLGLRNQSQPPRVVTPREVPVKARRPQAQPPRPLEKPVVDRPAPLSPIQTPGLPRPIEAPVKGRPAPIAPLPGGLVPPRREVQAPGTPSPLASPAKESIPRPREVQAPGAPGRLGPPTRESIPRLREVQAPGAPGRLGPPTRESIPRLREVPVPGAPGRLGPPTRESIPRLREVPSRGRPAALPPSPSRALGRPGAPAVLPPLPGVAAPRAKGAPGTPPKARPQAAPQTPGEPAVIPPIESKGTLPSEQGSKGVPVLGDLPLLNLVFREPQPQVRYLGVPFLSDLPIIGRLFVNRIENCPLDSNPPPAVLPSEGSK